MSSPGTRLWRSSPRDLDRVGLADPLPDAGGGAALAGTPGVLAFASCPGGGALAVGVAAGAAGVAAPLVAADELAGAVAVAAGLFTTACRYSTRARIGR